MDDPVRIYDSSLNETIFLNIPRPLARVFDELRVAKYIKEIAIRSIDSRIYDGENHRGYLMEAVEKGSIFSWNLDELPQVSKLYDVNYYEDCLWIKAGNGEMTFEELCEDFHDDGENVVTQMIHLQYAGSSITHLDHEYIFYDLESYEKRKLNVNIKGQAKRWVKTFKIDRSDIPMDYPCRMVKENEDILVPFIYFVLNNYFEHKELLEEYFGGAGH